MCLSLHIFYLKPLYIAHFRMHTTRPFYLIHTDLIIVMQFEEEYIEIVYIFIHISVFQLPPLLHLQYFR